jgi:folate-binding protein YgfZ
VVVGAAAPLGGPTLRLLTAAAGAPALWQELLARAAELRPAGATTEETLRVEAGLPAPGGEVDERFNPLELGLDESISFSKGCYTGQEVMARLRTYDKVQRRLRQIRLDGGALPAPGSAVRVGTQEIGIVTSAVHSPALGAPLALALIGKAHAAPGTQVIVASTAGELIEIATETADRAPDTQRE